MADFELVIPGGSVSGSLLSAAGEFAPGFA